MGTAVRPAKTSPGPWDALADVDAFVDEVLAELKAMAEDGSRPMRSGPKPPLAGATLRKAVMAIWCVCLSALTGTDPLLLLEVDPADAHEFCDLLRCEALLVRGHSASVLRRSPGLRSGDGLVDRRDNLPAPVSVFG